MSNFTFTLTTSQIENLGLVLTPNGSLVGGDGETEVMFNPVLTALSNFFTAQQERVAEVEGFGNETDKLVARLEGRIKQLEVKLTEMEDVAAEDDMDVQHHLGAMEEHLEAMKTQVSRLESNFEDEVDAITGRKLSDLAERMDDLTGTVEDLERKVSDVETSIGDLEDTVRDEVERQLENVDFDEKIRDTDFSDAIADQLSDDDFTDRIKCAVEDRLDEIDFTEKVLETMRSMEAVDIILDGINSWSTDPTGDVANHSESIANLAAEVHLLRTQVPVTAEAIREAISSVSFTLVPSVLVAHV